MSSANVNTDRLNFVAKLSGRKVWNAFKVFISFYLSKWRKKPMQWGLPFNVSIEPTTSCNLGCPECPSGLKSFTRPTGKMDPDLFHQLLDQLDDHLIYLYFYFQGEPFLHPGFLDLVKSAAQKSIYTVTSTNAHFLTKRKATETVVSGLDRIIISIDGSTQEVYAQYRKNGNLQKVIEGAKNLVAARKTLHAKHPYIVFQLLVVKPNQHQIGEIYKLAEEIGVDEVKLKTAQIYNFEEGNNLIPTIDKFSRYQRQPDGSYRIKNKLLNQCWKLWHSCVVTWDGKVVPCCFDKDADHVLGDLNQQEFAAIWKGPSYDHFRKQILKSRAEIEICKNCTEGTKVWV